MSQEQLNRIEAKLDRIDTALHGEGDSPGLKTRVALLEQTVGRWSKLILAATSAAILAAGGTLWNLLVGGK